MHLFLLLACGAPEAPVAADPPVVEAAAVELPPVEYPRPTTKGDQALEGLDARILNLQRSLRQLDSSKPALIEALSLRMAFTGRVSDLDQMMAVAREDGPDRAKVLLAAHRFDEAVAMDPSLADSVALAREQDLERLETERRAAVESHPNMLAWSRLADVLAARGKTAEADRAYWEALQAYRDVSPLTVADLQFRRGLLWGESGEDPERARLLYMDAVKRLPGFVRAHVHLAEVERELDRSAAAVARVRKVADAEDPEPAGKLAVWLEGEEAERYRAQATTVYDGLLKRHPLAFADHATEFFLAIGDTERAGELAKLNVGNRDTQRARDLCERAGCDAPE